MSSYSENLRVGTQWLKNLRAEIFHFKAQKYKNLLSQASSGKLLYVCRLHWVKF